MQGSLPAGGLAFTGRELNPLDRYKKVSDHSFSSSGFILAQEGSSLISCILIKSDARADTSNRTMSFNNPTADDQNIPDVLAES